MKWSYGLITTSSRDVIKPIEQLRKAGFDKPHVFVDSVVPHSGRYYQLGLDVTIRFPPAKVTGNTICALNELFYRNPWAERYALFQDDILCCKNIRHYLEALDWPEDRAYLNLYTFPCNYDLKPTEDHTGLYKSDQMGRGALGLVFNRLSLSLLLTSDHLLFHRACRGTKNPSSGTRYIGHKCVDGAISGAMKACGAKEYVHSPSLLQHTGKISSSENYPQPDAPDFPGEDFDCMRLGKKGVFDNAYNEKQENL